MEDLGVYGCHTNDKKVVGGVFVRFRAPAIRHCGQIMNVARKAIEVIK
jgi:hypothetical protein